jgi:GNAT superfamily N-acetyltransferase
MVGKKMLDLTKLSITSVDLPHYLLLKEFDCANGSLNRFLQNEAYILDISRESSTSLVLHDKNLVGYFTLTRTGLNLEESSLKELSHDSSLDIARFAIDKTYQEQGIGTYILDEIKKLAYRVNGVLFLLMQSMKIGHGI